MTSLSDRIGRLTVGTRRLEEPPLVVPTPDSAPVNRPGGRIYSLQWVRFVAAAMVLVYHAEAYLRRARGDGWEFPFVEAWFGPIGVALFFALSGHLMASAMMRYDAGRFLMHRVVRIYPTFFLVTALAVLAGLVAGVRLPLRVDALLLMPWGGNGYPLAVEWTLVLEVLFYVLVSLLIAVGRQRMAASFVTGWLGLILIHNVRWPDDPTTNVFDGRLLPFLAYNTAFAFGMLFALVVKRGIHPVLALILGVASWMVGQTQGLMGTRWGVGLGAAIVVTSLARFTGGRWLFGDTVLGRLGNRLGNYSYVLYLVHVPTVRILYAHWDGPLARRAFVAAVALALAVTIPLGEIDTRLYKVLKRRVDRLSLRVVSALAAGFGVVYLVQTIRFF